MTKYKTIQLKKAHVHYKMNFIGLFHKYKIITRKQIFIPKL